MCEKCNDSNNESFSCEHCKMSGVERCDCVEIQDWIKNIVRDTEETQSKIKNDIERISQKVKTLMNMIKDEKE